VAAQRAAQRRSGLLMGAKTGIPVEAMACAPASGCLLVGDTDERRNGPGGERMRILVAVVLLVSAGCVPDPGPTMAAGQDCLECHGGGEGEEDARPWTVAGTFTRGAHVDVTDANGKRVPMRGNKVGNFYTAESLTPPLTVTVDGRTMNNVAALTSGRLVYGGCNLCHVGGGVALADLGLMAPGRDCLRCHDGTKAPRFYAAGTFPGATSVTINGVNGTLMANGNFYITTQIAPPFTARVNSSTMSPNPTYGGCNACHGKGEAGGD
jgi:hypothetical protein